VLMPFASLSAKEGFVHRVEVWLQNRFNGDLTSLGIHLRSIDFSKEKPLDVLKELVKP
jgi:hypothetical protein